ncbi:hypothetical protein SUGI_0590760 [Cryptomeria japonica]|uniref:zinc finger CCCH domain-containing protein 56 n=1 Tax=Cryptomeria japonica TaxID=3369 RepID=UPI0024146C2D|nr:zinc finger CCCH domain-containing protein 56 [Cryptomeria japonica]GLJ29883.1 hypothetical protein SUGI_0590760 [Cryptomeria japonica]
MEYEVETSGVAAEIGMGMSGVGIEVDGYWAGVNEQEIWATEEEYDQASQGYRLSDGGGWSGGMDYRVGGFEGRQSRSGSEPSHKKSKNTHGDFQGNGSRGRGGYQGEFVQGTSSGTPPPSNGTAEGGSTSGGGKGKGTGRMFFKTKLCCKFRAGTCPYSSNCNFAHGMEELRKPPPNWQEIVAAQEDHTPRSEIRGENQIPCVSSSAAGGDSQRFHKTRHCKKFYTEAGCPYGDSCNFVHDDQSRSRESVAISLGPTTSTGSGNGAGNGNNGNGPFQRPLNWKTRICNKWETTGHCPFGEKCHFAHGLAELQKFGGGIADADNGDASVGPRNDLKQTGTLTKSQMEAGSGQATSVYNTDNFVIGTSNQRSIGSFLVQKQGQKILPKWKGPDKISKIYGDWIEDNEWEYITRPTASPIEKVNQAEEEITNEV